MKKLLPILIIMLLLSACNLPGEVDYSQDPIVQTSVSRILTKGAQTQESTLLAQTSTNLPSQTETPPADTQVQAETVTTTETAVAEPIPSQTPAPSEVVSTDPWGGEAAFTEDFTTGDYWDFESNNIYSKINNGQLEFISKGTPWWSSWYTTDPEFKNGYFETTFTMPNCQGFDRFGLVIRWGGSGDFYYMGVTCNGNWGFTLYTAANETIDLLTYQTSDALNPVEQTNQIGILAKDNTFDFYINREKVGSFSNDVITEGGNFGFLTMSSGTPNFKTLIERLDYWSK